MPEKVKVTFIHPDLGIGGAERLVVDVAGALNPEHFQCKFVTNHFDPKYCFEELAKGKYNVEVIGDWLPVDIRGRFYALCSYIRMVFLTLVYLLTTSQIDKPSVYFVDLIPIAIPFLKWANCRVVYYCHHPDLLASKPGGFFKKLYRTPINWLEMKATGMADVILVNSEYTGEIFRKTFPQIKKPLRTLYPTIASSFAENISQMTSPRPIKEILQIQTPHEDLKIFLSINRFHQAKCLELAVVAMDILRKKLTPEVWDKVFLVMAGGYTTNSSFNVSCFNELTEIIKTKNLRGKVFLEKSPSEQVKTELIHGCTALIYTPIYEHFGIVPLEAMLMAKPVIACNSGGPRETVRDGVTGFLCEPTSEGMAYCMRKMLEADTVQMGLNGARRLQDVFSNESFVKRLSMLMLFALEQHHED